MASRVFYHGTSISAAAAILQKGIARVSVNTNPHPQGAFFTVAATEKHALRAASHWATRPGRLTSGSITILELSVPAEIVDDLTKDGLIVTDSPAAVLGFPMQTVFYPLALSVLNQHAKIRLVDPDF